MPQASPQPVRQSRRRPCPEIRGFLPRLPEQSAPAACRYGPVPLNAPRPLAQEGSPRRLDVHRTPSREERALPCGLRPLKANALKRSCGTGASGHCHEMVFGHSCRAAAQALAAAVAARLRLRRGPARRRPVPVVRARRRPVSVVRARRRRPMPVARRGGLAGAMPPCDKIVGNADGIALRCSRSAFSARQSKTKRRCKYQCASKKSHIILQLSFDNC